MSFPIITVIAIAFSERGVAQPSDVHGDPSLHAGDAAGPWSMVGIPADSPRHPHAGLEDF